MWRRKLLASLLGVVLTLGLMELVLAGSYWAYLSLQKSRNLASISKESGEIRVLCIGESTTGVAGNEQQTMLVPGTSYPTQLERILNERQDAYTYKVLNNGMMGGRTTATMALLDQTIDDIQPHMIIAMMGIKDRVSASPLDRGIPDWMRGFRTVQLYQWLRETWIMQDEQVEPDVEVGDELPMTRQMNRPAKTYVRELRASQASKETMQDLKHVLYLWYIGRLQRAEKKIRSIIESEGYGYNVLARVLGSAERYPEAIAVLREAQARYPDEGMYLVTLIEMQLEMRDFAGAEATAAIAEQRIDDVEEAWLVRNYIHIALAQNHLAHRRPEAALAELEQVESEGLEEFRPVMPSIDYLIGGVLGETHIMREDWEAAEEALKAVISHFPVKHSNTWLLSTVYRRMGQYEEEEALRRSLLDRTGRMADYFELAKLFQLTGNGDKVPELMTQAIERIPDVHEGYKKLYDLTAERGIELVVMQYPGFAEELMYSYAPKRAGIRFIDNEHLFDADPDGYFFEPRYPNSFTHYTVEGADLMAQHVADTVLDVFAEDGARD